MNDIRWSEALDKTFESNWRNDPSLLWQYFASTTGFLRLYPGLLIFFCFLYFTFVNYCVILYFVFVKMITENRLEEANISIIGGKKWKAASYRLLSSRLAVILKR